MEKEKYILKNRFIDHLEAKNQQVDFPSVRALEFGNSIPTTSSSTSPSLSFPLFFLLSPSFQLPLPSSPFFSLLHPFFHSPSLVSPLLSPAIPHQLPSFHLCTHNLYLPYVTFAFLYSF